MSERGRRPRNKARTISHVARDVVLSLPTNSPVLEMFVAAAMQLNDRYDRHERLVKLSRDVTIESKRIIFQLHSTVVKEEQMKVANEALERLNKLIRGPIRTMALELENRPAYLHSRAVTAGLQEFIEARTLCHFIIHKELITWQEIQKNEFQYTIKFNDDKDERSVVMLLPHSDYMLGLADLTGELMRRAINSISSGDSDDSFLVCQLMRELYTGFLGLYGAGREISRKMSTTRSNTLKSECAVYALCVRGHEAPATLLATGADRGWDPPHSLALSDDEGYY